MNKLNQAIPVKSPYGFWLFCPWFFSCVGLYFFKIPPHPIQSFHYLLLPFQYSAWTGGQILQAWRLHALFVASLLGTLVVFMGTGSFLLNWVSRVFSMEEKWVWSLALGFIFWGLLAEALAFEKLFYFSLMRGLIELAFGLILVKDRQEAFARCWPFWVKREVPRYWIWPLSFMALLSLANLMAPEMSWDAMTYQLIIPKFYFFNHGFYPVTGIVPASYPSLGEMFFSWGLIWGDDSLARSFAFLAHFGTAIALVGFGNRLENPNVGWTAALIYWAFPYLNIYSTRGYVDLFTGFYAVLGLGAIVVFVANRKNSMELNYLENIDVLGFLGLLALGATWGIKYNAITFWLAGVFILTVSFFKHRIGIGFWRGLLLFPLFFFGPWAMKSWIYFHNPLFPYLPKYFHAFDWSDFDQTASAIKFQIEGWKGLLKLPGVLWGIFFQNYSGAPHEEISLLPLLLLPLLLLKGKESRWKGPLLTAILIPFFFWLVTSHQLRLISGVIALLSLFLATAYFRAIERWPKHENSFNLLLGIYFWILVFYLFQGLIQQPNPFANFLGFQSRSQFLTEILQPKGYVQVAEYLNQKLPADAKVLILGQQNGYYLDRISAFDFDYTYPVLKKWTEKSTTPGAIYSQFKRNGFTHILYNANGMMGTAVRVDRLGVDRYPWNGEELKNYEQFFLKYTQKVSLPVSNGYSLYEVIPRDGFSALPDNLPGTEYYYLKSMKETLGLATLSDMVGKPIPADVYLKSYSVVADQHPEIGYPCFQWAFAKLANHPHEAGEVLKMGKEGFARNDDKASWLALQGDVSLVQKKNPKAISLLEEARKLSPEREDVARNLAAAYYNEHDLKKALEEADRAAALAPFSEEYQQLAHQLRAIVSSAPR